MVRVVFIVSSSMLCCYLSFCFVFFKQKTAYEMRISDWSSDVCSSDLAIIDRLHGPGFAITDRTIDSHIRNLRAKFVAAGGGDVIETRAGIGYSLGTCTGG